MIEEISNKFEKAMKKGFISTLILLVLKKESSHGYQIKKAIEERTLGVWTPSDSTMYTILKNLREKELIKPIEQQEADDSKKVYELTHEGKKTLELMMKKQKEMRESMRAIITSTFGFSDDLLTEEIKDSYFDGPFSERFTDKSNKEKIHILNFQKSFMSKRMNMMKKKIQNIELQIAKLDENQ